MCREAELGFLGLIVATLLTVPFICGRAQSAGVREKFPLTYVLLRRIACLILANCTPRVKK